MTYKINFQKVVGNRGVVKQGLPISSREVKQMEREWWKAKGRLYTLIQRYGSVDKAVKHAMLRTTRMTTPLKLYVWGWVLESENFHGVASEARNKMCSCTSWAQLKRFDKVLQKINV